MMIRDGLNRSQRIELLAGLRIGIVTEEVAGLGSSGGIGAAMLELAVTLASGGALVDLLHLPSFPLAQDKTEACVARCAAMGVKLRQIDPSEYVWGDAGPEKRSYSVYCALQERQDQYDVLHFHDYRGLGFYTQCAKHQGIAFPSTTIIVQTHGPTRWALEANHNLFAHIDQLKCDFMERRSIELADWLVSPSHYLIDWMRQNDFRMPAPNRIRVIRNACLLAADAARSTCSSSARGDEPIAPGDDKVRAGEVILFARHEERKGVAPFMDALDLLNPLLTRRRVQVTMLGALGDIGGSPSGIMLTRRARRWTFPFSIRTQFDRPLSLRYLAQAHGAVVVVPSPEENAPYAIVEAALAGRPVITSRHGGARELIDSAQHEILLCDITPQGLASSIRLAVEHGLPPAQLAQSAHEVGQAWHAFHVGMRPAITRRPPAKGRRPVRPVGTRPRGQT